MTEIPEHLLKRSQARKAAGGDAAAASAPASAPATTPATSPAAGESAVPAVAAPKAPAIPAGPPPPKPDIPVVAAYKARKKIPVWAMVTLSILPLWVFMYLLALKPPEVTAEGPLGVGAEVYAGGGNCAGCHGAEGAGIGSAYGFVDGDAMKTFPHIEDQLRWVAVGGAAYAAAGVDIAGDPNREGGPHITGASGGIMPARGGAELTDAEVLAAVCEERYALGGVAEEGEEFELWCSEEAPTWIALETDAATFENLHTVIADKGIMEIGSIPKAGTTAGE